MLSIVIDHDLRSLWLSLAEPVSCYLGEVASTVLQGFHQEFNEEIPAGLPAGTRVAHKTGWITGVLHDAAVVYPRDRTPYVLVVLTRGIPDDKVARQLIADISRLVYQATVPTRASQSR